MHVTRDTQIENWWKPVFILGLMLITIVLGKVIVSGAYLYILVLLFSGGVLFLYRQYYEIFILLVLAVNDEFFYLMPRPSSSSKDIQYQGLMYLILAITGIWYFFREKRADGENCNKVVIFLIFLSIIAVINTYFQGQPIVLGLSATRGYFLILFYFVFMSKNIDRKKLFQFLIIVGVFLSFANNIQYILYGKINLFYIPREMVRAGQLRMIQNSAFITFSSLIAFGEYLKSKKRIYLIAFLYMVATLVIQGQSRAAMIGLVITISLLLVLTKRLNVQKAVLVAGPLIFLIVLLLPVLQSTFLGELYDLTKYSFETRSGGVAIRIETLNYYYGELSKSPFIGRGIWYRGFKENNPEDMSHAFMYLSDLGISTVLFHFGILGLIWLLMLFFKAYKLSFIQSGKLKENIHLGIVGYFILSIFIMGTQNILTTSRTIIYLAFALALLTQMNNTNHDYGDIEAGKEMDSPS